MGDARSALIRRVPALDWQLAITLLLTVGLLAPVVVVPGTFFPYVVPRNILFRVAVELAAAALVGSIVLGRKRLDLRREYVLCALGTFLVVITLSALGSPARDHSLYGDFERMGGVWAWLHLALFFLLLRAIDAEHLAWLLNAALAVSVYAGVHGILEHLSAVVGQTTGRLSLVGNPGLFAGYLLVASALALYLASVNGRYRWLYAGAAAIDLAALVMTQNRSSILGLLAGAIAATLLLGATGGRERRWWVPPAFVGGLAVAVTTLVAAVRAAGDGPLSRAVPGVVRRIAHTDFTGRDASRAVQWEAALAGFRDRPALGYGPENHHLVWSAHFDPRIYDLGTDVFDRTHNQFLELLATTGLVGTIGFIAIWAAIGYSLYRAFRERRLSARQVSLLAGANVAYAIYLVFWFVDISAAMLWMLVAAVIAARCRAGPVVRDRERPISGAFAAAGLLASAAVIVLVLHRHAYVPLRASTALATLDSYGGDLDRALEAVRTVSSSSARQTSHTGPVLAQFIGSLAKGGELDAARADSPQRKRLDHAFKAVISALDSELTRDPLNDRLHTYAAGVMIEAASFYGSRAYLERAITLLKRAIELSPRRREQRQLLAIAYAKDSTARFRP